MNTAAEDVPLFVTDASVPGSTVVVSPTDTVAASPLLPWMPCGPLMLTDVGFGKSPLLVQDIIPSSETDGVNTAPGSPFSPSLPGLPFCPSGIVKLNTAALDVPELVTEALEPG